MYFCAYYTKGVKRFNKTKFGWCWKKENITTSQDGCEKCEFRQNNRIKGVPVRYWLNEILTELCAVRQIVEEYENESEKPV